MMFGIDHRRGSRVGLAVSLILNGRTVLLTRPFQLGRTILVTGLILAGCRDAPCGRGGGRRVALQHRRLGRAIQRADGRCRCLRLGHRQLDEASVAPRARKRRSPATGGVIHAVVDGRQFYALAP